MMNLSSYGGRVNSTDAGLVREAEEVAREYAREHDLDAPEYQGVNSEGVTFSCGARWVVVSRYWKLTRLS